MGVGRYALLFLLMVSIVSAADASVFDTAVDSVSTFFDWVIGGITGLAIDDGSVSTASAWGYVNSDVTLTNNISSSGTCFTVNTGNVVIDCNRYSITGDSTLYGVHSAGHSNVTVQNCVISDYVKATFLTGGSDHTVRDNTLFELDRGVDIVGGVNHVVVNNSIFNTTYALHLVTDNSDIVNNTLFNNSEYGLRLFNSDTILVDGNEFIMNTQGGVHLDNSENTVTSNNVFRDNLHRNQCVWICNAHHYREQYYW